MIYSCLLLITRVVVVSRNEGVLRRGHSTRGRGRGNVKKSLRTSLGARVATAHSGQGQGQGQGWPQLSLGEGAGTSLRTSLGTWRKHHKHLSGHVPISATFYLKIINLSFLLPCHYYFQLKLQEPGSIVMCGIKSRGQNRKSWNESGAEKLNCRQSRVRSAAKVQKIHGAVALLKSGPSSGFRFEGCRHRKLLGSIW